MNRVPGFLPSRYGFRFRNAWPPGPARVRLGPMRVPIGNVARGLCGGMIFAARDRFHRAQDAPTDPEPPAPDTPLFDEIVRRQLASFGTLLVAVPLRFWLAAGLGQRRRDRETVTAAWPAIRADIDAGRPAMVGLIRLQTWNPFAPLGHQVVAYRYDERPDRVAIGIYDPNHPGDDVVEVRFEHGVEEALRLEQSSSEILLGLLHLPYSAPR